MNVGNNTESAFNAGVEYLKTLTTYEREIALGFWNNDFTKVHNGLDVLYMELYEWFNVEELKKNKDIRERETKAHNIYLQLIAKGKNVIPTEIIETYKDRFIQLKQVIHNHSLRMAKKEDMTEEPEEW